MKPIDPSELGRLKKAGLSALHPPGLRIAVGMATCGLAAGAGAVYEAIQEEAGRAGLDGMLIKTGCLGYCQQEPLVDVRLPGRGRILYSQVSEKAVPDMIAALAQGRLPPEGALAVMAEDGGSQEARPEGFEHLPLLDELPFYARQQKVVLLNSGLINPVSIEEYIAGDGYQALARVLSDGDPERVVEAIARSGLRGRGGGGFPTGRKWRICREAGGEPRYIICNADEGDPGAYMDRTVLESDPHSVIEGLIIGGYAIGANQGYIYVRDEYPLAVEKLTGALAQAEELGLAGPNIFGSGFDFDITIVRGAGAFVCGEETALIGSIEGALGEPHPKPPFPAVQGLWGRPTVVNNVKTLASAPIILRRGPDWYRSIGTEGNSGTVVFSLVGQVANTGLVEVPMGLTLKELLEDVGGGGLSGKRIKAVQTGGPSGGCIPARLFDLPIDFESLTGAGSIMGSGGMVVMDEGTCMVDVAKYFLAFTKAESCGKCTPCRDGIRELHNILSRITAGRSEAKDLVTLEEIAGWVKTCSICGLGQTAPNPVLTTLRYFRDEYQAHVLEKRCPAGVCSALIELAINQEVCNGCGLCLRECPAGAISGQKKAPHVIDPVNCTRCRICADVCPEGAVQVVR